MHFQIDIFRDHGEIVLSLGSSYRSHNQAIYSHSDIAISIDMLPSELSSLSSSSSDIIAKYPEYHSGALCQADLSFLFRLVGLQTCAILQAPCPIPSDGVSSRGGGGSGGSHSHSHSHTEEQDSKEVEMSPFLDIPAATTTRNTPAAQDTTKKQTFIPSIDLLESVGAFSPDPSAQPSAVGEDGEMSLGGKDKDKDRPLNLRSLMEAIRTGRLFLLNAQQCLGFVCIALNVTALWSLYCQAVPLSTPPVLSPAMLLLFICLYIPGEAVCGVESYWVVVYRHTTVYLALLYTYFILHSYYLTMPNILLD